MKHVNVAIFVPDLGCPQRCSYCNQHLISAHETLPTADDIRRAAETAVRSGADTENGEICFFGGSFTSIDSIYRSTLLDAAYPYVENGYFHGIRISTRPDAVNNEILRDLKNHGVTTIELGCPSMDDEVLRLNHRGHTAKQVENACRAIRNYGIQLGVQMMTGLYGDTPERSIETARKLIALRPDMVRIYPTLVLFGTKLAGWMAAKVYQPQTLEEAVPLCATLIQMFEDANIPVIRVGLQANNSLDTSVLAGPYHPALRELCEGYRYFEKMKALLSGAPHGAYTFRVGTRYLSQAIGHLRYNVMDLHALGYEASFITDDTLQQYEIYLQGITS